MNFLYRFIIHITSFLLKGFALFNSKIQLGVKGRSKTFQILQNSIRLNEHTLWFHCASLGEYEQGLPVFKELRKDYPSHKIVLTFFSPSGYEIKKNNSIADVVVYLPLDTKKNAKRFLDCVHPELTVFVKYEIWPIFLNELKLRNHKAVLISALFRHNHLFFKPYGKLMRQALFSFDHIFTQNNESKALLEGIGYSSVSVSGDTRFDRVTQQLQQDNTLEFVELFKQDKLCVVAGSTWPEGERLLVNYINKTSLDTKFIVAPHNIKPNQINALKNSIKKKTLLFSEKDHKTLSNYNVLIINTVGLLSKIYNYADIAYVGGALGKTGLHNTLEAATFKTPIIIGNHYEKFPEANGMIKAGGMFSIANQTALNDTLNLLLKDHKKRNHSGQKNYEYIIAQKGAIVQIMNYLRIQ